MGVLVGTSLIVIIPEGVETLYSASLIGNAHVRRAPNTRWQEGALRDTRPFEKRDAGDLDASFMPGSVLPDSIKDPPATPNVPGTIGLLENEGDKKDPGEDLQSSKGGHHDDSPHAWIGLALISGFILMYLIDKLPQYAVSSKSAPQPYHISLNDLGRGLQRPVSPSHDSEANGFLQNSDVSQSQRRSFATTTGLVIHAAADGIALGASSSSTNTGLSFIIFLAIMVHKAPAAFGLTSVLLKQGLSKRTARAHLLLFSVAAPMGATFTWLFAHFLGAGTVGNAHNTNWWTAMLLLFSGGTFLYVAMHTMQEVGNAREVQMNGHPNRIGESRNAGSETQKPTPRDLVAAVIGMILPLFLQIGHAH
jgi:solute carrier family 39 (zinc transporter), member 9